MSDTASSFVRQELLPERAAPVKVTGFVGFLRARLFNSPTNIECAAGRELTGLAVHREDANS